MKKILIVDDSAAMRQMVKGILVVDGYEMHEAVDGRDGLDKITADEEIEIVVLDVNMPRMSGIELIQELHEQGRIGRGLKVVMLTTEGQIELIRQAKEAGAKGWVVKPFKPDLLLAAIRKIAA